MENKITLESNDKLIPHIGQIQYEGLVEVKIKTGNKTILQKSFHNTGGQELFKFLCKSLENSKDAKNYRPTKVKLFYREGSNPQETSIETLHSCSSCIVANEAKSLYGVLPGSSDPNNKTWYTTFHFTIPNILIHSKYGTEESKGEINEIRLYPENTEVDSGGAYEDYSADFRFTKNEGSAWDPIVINNSKHNYNLIISWTLSFKN